MRQVPTHTGLWKYLEQIGVLELGDVEKIKEAKANYWREYDRNYKRTKRVQHRREYTISFNADEVPILSATAKAKGLKIPEYIREATRADIKNIYVTPHPYLLREVQQLLLQYQNQIQAIKEKGTRNVFGISKDYESLERIITTVENHIVKLFTQAPSLIAMLEETLKRNPLFITTLHNIIKKYDHQIQNKKD